MSDEAQRPDDFDTAFQSSLAHLQVYVETACASEGDWAAKVSAGVRAALTFAAANPAAAQLLTNEAMSGGKPGFARYDRMIEHFAEALRPGRAERPTGEWLPEITEKTMVGRLAMLIAQRLSLEQHADLPALAPEAIQFVLTPYLGTADARRVAFGSSA
ncbi:MAG: hypothetical protein ABW196_06890 [Solirubrobacterales bacterium]